MRTKSLRLVDTAVGAPFYAMAGVLHGGAQWRRLDYFEIMAVVGGEGELVTFPAGAQPQRQLLRPGRMILFRPFDDPFLSGTGRNGMAVRYVSFPAADWRAFAGLTALDSSWATALQPPMADFAPEDPGVLAPFDRAIERFRADPTSFDLVQFWVGVVPMLLPIHGRKASGLGAPEWLALAVEAMHREENLRAGVRRFLALSHVSASYLAANTRRYYDATPTGLVTDLRLRQAASLLGTTSEGVGAIARRCGFASLTYFSNSFRRAYAVSPREYRLRTIGDTS